MEIKRIYINPGHSDTDPGAVGYETERRLNVIVSGYMNDHLLKNYECETRMNPGTMGSLSAIADDANKWGAELFISNHFNAGGGDGWEGLVYSNATVPLGKVFEKHVKATGQNSRGVKLRPGLAVLRLTNMPAILNEGGFVDNKKDIQDWNDDAELKKLGIAYAEAAAEYLDLQKKAASSSGSGSKPKEEANITMDWLHKGDEGDHVEVLQAILDGYGYTGKNGNPLSKDGVFGENTDYAVRNFQSRNGLNPDGIVGDDTWNKLLKQ